MTIDLTAAQSEAPWPPEPGPDAAPEARFAWYAAVARWAPSKHNSQPWRFAIRAPWLEVWLDEDRLLPATDPLRREAIISCGAAIHLVQVAALALGRDTTAVLLPHGDVGILARISETGEHSTTQQDRAMLAAVATRRTDRGPLNAAVLSPSLPFLLQRAAYAEHAALRLISSPGDRRTLASLVDRADRLSSRRGSAADELKAWLRPPGDPRSDGVSTSSTRGPVASQGAEFVQRDFSAPGSLPAHDRNGPDDPIVAILCTSGDRPQDWLTTGRALAAVLLQASMEGASASYLNQPVEDLAIRHQLHDHLALPGPAQLVLRLGAGGLVARPPRRAVERAAADSVR